VLIRGLLVPLGRRQPPLRLATGVYWLGGVVVLATVWVDARLVFWSPPFQLWVFLLGCIAALAYLRPDELKRQRFIDQLKTSRRSREVVLGVSLIAILASVLALPEGSAALNICVAPAFLGLIVAVASGRTCLGALLQTRPLLFLGEASYSLYILHYLPVCLATFLFGANPSAGGAPWWTNTAPTGCALGQVPSLSLLVITVGTSLVCYRWVESPARRWLRAQRQSSSPPVRLGLIQERQVRPMT
ncbi:MAG: acyltransferase family protein, partial [Chloroflexi bacterium]|nr:acyltransferase family protein [Chloroflexota bacterium]